MTTNPTQAALDIFDLRDAVIGEYQRFATSFTTIHAADIREQIDAIYAENRYWPEPLIQINPNYKRATDIATLVDSGLLHRGCADIFQVNGVPLTLYKHQEQAIGLAETKKSFVVTTGTGSGKSLCFFIPIVHRILNEKQRDATPRTRAIIVYPMNALANSQIEELQKFVGNLAGTPPITFARYTGQEDAAERQRIATHPPDILLTNFMMLELLMTRQEEVDRHVMDHCVGLHFLVLDEVHTYRGRQGADVALLVRRVRERLQPDALQCIGTSATMASEGSQEDKNAVVAEVASKLFAVHIPASQVVSETLERITDPHQSTAAILPLLGAAIDAGVGATLTNAELAVHPLAIWIETRLGVTFSDVDQRWGRARPMTETEAVAALERDAGRPAEACRKALRQMLLFSSTPERGRSPHPGASANSFFAFKLHQFLSGAGQAYATLEPPPHRTVVVDGQQFLPAAPHKRLYPVYFCRECGHAYHPVRLVADGGQQVAMPRSIDDAPPASDTSTDDSRSASEQEVFGFMTLDEQGDIGFDFTDAVHDYPESWLEFDTKGEARLKAYYRKARVSRRQVAPDGRLGSGAAVWFMPGTFRFCLRCGHVHSGATRDRNRLASLSAEGRSSATTVIVTSVLRWMHGERSAFTPFTRKILGFTDNRQDTALQAGHFNDFIFVSLLRAGFLAALQAAGPEGLESTTLGLAQQQALGFDRAVPELRREWLQEADLRGHLLEDAAAALRQVLAYRVWHDQRRGWRYTNPNLEQLGLVQVEYRGLDGLVADGDCFAAAHPLLAQATPAVRANLYREIFNHLRQSMAIDSIVLDRQTQEQLHSKSRSFLRSPWGFGQDESPQSPRTLMLVVPRRKKTSAQDQDLIVRGGSRSALGKLLRRAHLWGGDPAVRALKAKDFDALMGDLLDAARSYGLVTTVDTNAGEIGWRLNEGCVRFRLGDPAANPASSAANAFFRDLYANLAQMLRAQDHPLFGFEAREHTAQVDGDRRAVREKRFRYGGKEREELDASLQVLREMGEANRFLPVLFCSPTMELGVDISALNVVHMRNLPPTPANYAQRSGRAGRSGQAALVLTYASAQSPHDQYFFRDPRAMVHGEVRAPLLDLANQELVDSHLQAIWLSCVDTPLSPNISELLVQPGAQLPLRDDLHAAIHDARVGAAATQRIGRVLDLLADALGPQQAPWYSGRDAYAAATVAAAPVRFDRAFDRWRGLLNAAKEQRDAAGATVNDYAAPANEKKAAKTRRNQAEDQIELLQKGKSSQTSDFYTYRYLATEGFLPGYNFPRLPLLAYIPTTADGRGKQTYLQRPRFLALSEFGPRSLVYHEGRAYRVVRAMLAMGQRHGATPDLRLPTQTLRICNHCGAGHADEQSSMCHACGTALSGAEIVNNVFRIENVGTQPTDRITANDEERQRQGFDLQTTFVWATRDGALDVRNASVADAASEIARLAYGPGASIIRLNKGLRRRADKSLVGFKIDPVHGFWAKNEDDEDAVDPSATPRQWIVPSVQDHKNALLFKPCGEDLNPTSLTTIQHALIRGIEAVYQLEAGEVLAEALPTRDQRSAFLFYEATEGGAGVLVRLVAEAGALAAVARRALQIMHFDIKDGAPLPATLHHLVDQPDTACVAGCYRCLLSYFNQPEHEDIDRRDEGARLFLLRLASAQSQERVEAAPTAAPGLPMDATTAWASAAQAYDLPAADAKALAVGARTPPLVWRQHFVVALLESATPEILALLDGLGFEVVDFNDRSQWPAAFARLAKLLGRSE